MAATTLDTLLVRIDANLAPLRRQLAATKAQVDRAAEKMKQSFSRLGSSITALTSKIGKLRGGMVALAAVAAIAMGKKIADVNANFQDLELTLGTVFGGMEQGEAAMGFISEFAQRTPFDIQTLSKAFIQLGGAGIKPTEELLTTFGDAAAATTNRVAAFEAMVRIATRAVGGGLGLEELEQLVNQGIPVYTILQEQLGKTRLELTEMGQSAEGAKQIMDALQKGLNERFGGGMERASANLSVAMSNLGIAFNGIIRALGSGVAGTGLTGAFTFLSNTLQQALTIIKPFAHVLGSVLAAAIYVPTALLRALTETILYLANAVADLIIWAGDKLPDSFASLKAGAASLKANLKDLEEQMNSNLKPAEAISAVTKAQDEEIKKLGGNLVAAKAILAGYTEGQIEALRATKQFKDVTIGLNKEGKIDILFSGATPEQIAKNKEFLEIVKATNAAIKKANDEIENNNKIKDLTNDLQAEQNILLKAEGNARLTQFMQLTKGLNLGEAQYQQIWELFNLNQEIIEQNQRLAKAKADENQQLEDAISIAQGYRSEAQNLQEQMDQLTAAVEKFGVDAIPNATEAMEQLALKIKMETNPALKQVMDAAENAGNSIADNLAEGITKGKLSLSSFLDVARQFVKELISQFIKTYIIKRILGSIFGGGGGFGSLFSGGGGGNITATGGSGFAGGGAVRGFAGGGSAPMLVGERGPEMFVPHSAGSIKNNMDTKNILGSAGQGVVVNQTINVDAGVAQTVRAEILSMLPAIKQDTLQAVVDARRRGGSFATAFGG
jgi:hypothetical protein